MEHIFAQIVTNIQIALAVGAAAIGVLLIVGIKNSKPIRRFK